MKYRDLPLYQELSALARDQGEEASQKALEQYALELFRCKGMQIITHLLRELESGVLYKLRHGRGEAAAHSAVLVTIESIRASLAACLPVEARGNVDWFDDGEEEFLIDAKSTGE